MKKPQTVLSRHYPRFIDDRDGARRRVETPHHHGQMMFTEYNDDATPKYPPPPTLREALEKGYAADYAIAFVKEEERKALAHEWPYYAGAPAEDPNAIPATPFDEEPTAVFVPEGTFADAETAARLDAAVEQAEQISSLQVQAQCLHPEFVDSPIGIGRMCPMCGFAEKRKDMPESEPLPELPHETEIAPVSEIPTVEPTKDEIEAMFAEPKESAPAKPPKPSKNRGKAQG